MLTRVTLNSEKLISSHFSNFETFDSDELNIVKVEKVLGTRDNHGSIVFLDDKGILYVLDYHEDSGLIDIYSNNKLERKKLLKFFGVSVEDEWVKKWEIPSFSRPKMVHEVSLLRNGQYNCTCEDFQNRTYHKCKHIKTLDPVAARSLPTLKKKATKGGG